MISVKLTAAVIAVLGGLMGVSLIYASAADSLGHSVNRGAVFVNEETLTRTSAVTTTESISGSLRIAQAIADFFNTYQPTAHQLTDTVPLSITAEAVLDLKVSGMGYGEIVKAIVFAQVSGQSVDDIVDLRTSGMGWGEIKKTVEDSITGKLPNLGTIMREAKNKKNASQAKGEDSNSSLTPDPTATPAAGGSRLASPQQGKGKTGDKGNKVDSGQGKGKSDNAPGKRK